MTVSSSRLFLLKGIAILGTINRKFARGVDDGKVSNIIRTLCNDNGSSV